MALANFYDVLIDNPNSQSMLHELLRNFLTHCLLSKDFADKCDLHVKALEELLQQEYVS